MRLFSLNSIAVAGFLLALSSPPSQAQTLGYADSLGVLAKSCGADIAKLCKNVNLGGGKMMKCLGDNSAKISPTCKGSIAATQALLASRAKARVAVLSVCKNDIIRVCGDVKPGDGAILDCYLKSKHLFTPACRQAAFDAGYEVKVDPNTPTTQISLDPAELDSALQGAGAALSAASLKQMAAQALKDPSRSSRMNRAPLIGGLDNRAQLTIAIQFDLNSARIDPASFQAVGLMADALYHPYLQGYRFLVVGHTDATGNRELNLKLSQQRADAIRDALINPFGIAPNRIEAVGLGEEQLLTPANPDNPENRRVQLINIGPVQ